MTQTTKIQEQLRILLQLTNTEAQVAQVRVAQARTDAVRCELTENKEHAKERAGLISEALQELGGYADLVTPAVGRIAALLKSPLEQIEPLSEALLQDLQLEHQLLDRSRYLLVLAKAAELPRTVALADRLIVAHSATVEWLTTVLAEEALGGPAALAPTPLQRAAGVATRAAILPNKLAVQGVNRSVHTVQRTTGQALTRLSDLGERAGGLADGARQVFTTVGTAPHARAAMPIAMARSPDDATSAAIAATASTRQPWSSRLVRQEAPRCTKVAATINVGTTATVPVRTAPSTTPCATCPAHATHAARPLTNQVTRCGRTRPRSVSRT